MKLAEEAQFDEPETLPETLNDSTVEVEHLARLEDTPIPRSPIDSSVVRAPKRRKFGKGLSIKSKSPRELVGV